jgi:hypothetical protein
LVDKLYLRVRLVNGDCRHLLCEQPDNMAAALGDAARQELRAFIEAADAFSSDWLPTAEGTWVARSGIIEAVPVSVNADNPPWSKWTNADSRVLPLTQS